MGQPARMLPPLTASQLPDVSRALALNPHPAATPPARAPARVDEDAPTPPRPVATTYTLGQLVEMVGERKRNTQRVVASGDPDGPAIDDLPWIGGRL